MSKKITEQEGTKKFLADLRELVQTYDPVRELLDEKSRALLDLTKVMLRKEAARKSANN